MEQKNGTYIKITWNETKKKWNLRRSYYSHKYKAWESSHVCILYHVCIFIYNIYFHALRSILYINLNEIILIFNAS